MAAGVHTNVQEEAEFKLKPKDFVGPFFAVISAAASASPDPIVAAVCTTIVNIKAEIDKLEAHQAECLQFYLRCEGIWKCFEAHQMRVKKTPLEKGVEDLNNFLKNTCCKELQKWRASSGFKKWLKLDSRSKRLRKWKDTLDNKMEVFNLGAKISIHELATENGKKIDRLARAAGIIDSNGQSGSNDPPNAPIWTEDHELTLSKDNVQLSHTDGNAIADMHIIRFHEREDDLLMVKTLRDAKSAGPIAKQLLLDELQVWESREHPNVLKISGISTRLFESVSLIYPRQNQNLLEYCNSNPDSNALRLLAGAAAGINYIHSVGSVHGNLKSANILITQELQPVVHDFEVYKAVRFLARTDFKLWELLEKHTTESKRWHSPEIMRHDDEDYELTTESDVWAFGMVIELVRYRGAIPERPDHPCLSDEVWYLLTQCLAREPDDRPTMREVEERLSKAADLYDQQERTGALI